MIIILRPDFTSKLVHILAFGTSRFYIAPYDKIKHELVNLSSNCDVKSGLSVPFLRIFMVVYIRHHSEGFMINCSLNKLMAS